MTIKCISPIDGSVYAERQTLSRRDADAAVIRANTAQKEWNCLLYTSPSPRDRTRSRMPSSA